MNTETEQNLYQHPVHTHCTHINIINTDDPIIFLLPSQQGLKLLH